MQANAANVKGTNRTTANCAVYSLRSNKKLCFASAAFASHMSSPSEPHLMMGLSLERHHAEHTSHCHEFSHSSTSGT
jgi:hypothetical protein